MCRHLAYTGPPVALGAVLVEAPHSLAAQACNARHQTSGTENPDGWGVGWFDDAGRPRRHRSATPIWSDVALATLARGVVASDVVAAVRLASPGSPVEESGNAPFLADDRWFFSLNGVVDGYHDGIGRDLRARVSECRRAGIEGESDSEVLFALALDRLDAGRSASEALVDVVTMVEQHTTGRLNLVLSERGSIAATAVGNSLFHLGAALIASEPLDDSDGWERLADRTVVTCDGERVSVASL